MYPNFTCFCQYELTFQVSYCSYSILCSASIALTYKCLGCIFTDFVARNQSNDLIRDYYDWVFPLTLAITSECYWWIFKNIFCFKKKKNLFFFSKSLPKTTKYFI